MMKRHEDRKDMQIIGSLLNDFLKYHAQSEEEISYHEKYSYCFSN